ncbi:MAG: ComEC family competence protein [Candidatus Omnitrophica bacterium]|nr:ComEC family competence protein [Candidatus Omnitrophota bacterium]MBU1128111.1 ComEC family competence protein [Candidatus Omnitrophota bacterium]MBU1784505.1 ComEC family competence protein [Candidatus Omnitrophota bacterium]MBU1851095.1 ComEC family competence protein [Candidatus Omnitrophota bacterium]
MRRPLLFPVIFFLGGVVASGTFGISCATRLLPVIAFVLICLIVLQSALRKTRALFYITLFTFFFMLGYSRHISATILNENDISAYIGKQPCREVVISGTVAGYPESRNARYVSYSTFPFQVRRLLTKDGEYKVGGRVLVELYSLLKKPSTGDELIIAGKLSRPGGEAGQNGFNYRAYLKRKGITAVFSSKERDLYLKSGETKDPSIVIKRSLFSLRKNADRVTRTHLNGTARSVIESVVLGLRGGMPREIKNIFKKTGTMHILAVSGLHTGVVGCVFMGMLYFLRCPRKTSYWLTMAVILSFAVFAGGRASSMRAAVMGSVILISRVMERNPDVLNALFVAAFLSVFFQPMQIFQPGFILSYTAVLSILYVKPLSDSLLSVPKRRHKESGTDTARRIFLDSSSVSLAVWVGMMPIVAKYFSVITPSMIPANLLAIPVLFVLVILGAVLILTGSFAQLSPISGCIAFLINSIITFFINAMKVLSRVPFSSIEVPSPGILVVLMYYFALGGVILLFRKTLAKNTKTP